MEVTVMQMKQIERDADAHGLSYIQMMENAGQAAARTLRARCPRPIRTAAVFCGTGNNGGDGFVLARALKEWGCDVRVLLVGGVPKTSDAILNWNRADALGIPCLHAEALTAEQTAFVLSADAVVDGVYGTGFHGVLRPEGRQAADLYNQASGFHLALDLPSGLAADTGEAAPGVMRADWTVTFHASKPCHRLNPDVCGTVDIAPIGVETVL